MDLLVLIDAVQTTDCNVCVLMKLGKTPQHMHRKVFKAGWILLLHHRSNNSLALAAASSMQHHYLQHAGLHSDLSISQSCVHMIWSEKMVLTEMVPAGQSLLHLGSLIRSQAKMVGSSLYLHPLMVFTLLVNTFTLFLYSCITFGSVKKLTWSDKPAQPTY